MITVIVLVVLLIAGLLVQKALSSSEGMPDVLSEKWKAAEANERSEVGRVLLKVSRPLGTIPSIYQAGESRQYQALQNKLIASGMYGTSVEVFLAVQSVVTFVSILILVGIFASGVSGAVMFAGMFLAALLLIFPYVQIVDKVKKQNLEAESALPEFAELLLMPLESGMTIMAALSFTADRIDGPVSEAVKDLRRLIDSRSMPEVQAFQYAGAKLGTPEAQAFFTTLMQAHLEGSRVIKNLQVQAQALRDAAFQRQRGRLNKLSTAITLIFGIHFMPAILVLAILPAIVSLGNI